MKKIAIMQPYFLPYIGYFQLINAVDEFVIYDNIEYTKKGWINRNRYLKDGKDALFSLSLQKDSDFLDVAERRLSSEFKRDKLIAIFKNNYAKAPYFKEIMPFITEIINFPDDNLFLYIHNSVIKICKILEIETKIIVSSEIDCNHSLKGKDRVIEICNSLEADIYVNAIGGVGLYNKHEFEVENLNLLFIKSNNIDYKQFNDQFVSWLSIVDVLMFNSKLEINKMLREYSLV